MLCGIIVSSMDQNFWKEWWRPFATMKVILAETPMQGRRLMEQGDKPCLILSGLHSYCFHPMESDGS